METDEVRHRRSPFIVHMPSKLIKRQKKRLARLKQVPYMNLFKLCIAALPTIVFGVFTVIFTLQQDASARAMRQQDQRQADEINRRTMFKDYIDDVRALLLDDDFEYNVDRSLLHIRVQTLTVLQHLDASRKHDVIRFLYENRLIQQNEPVRVNLRGADLSEMKFIKSFEGICDLSFLYLPGIYAKNVVFDGCWLSGAVFDDASMVGAKFHSCNMVGSTFRTTNLRQAKFDGNHLYKANFTGASLVQSSILGGTFQDLDLINADLFQSDINDQLLHPAMVGGLGPNILLNTRYSNGSFSDIDTSNLIISGQPQPHCHGNVTPVWGTILPDSSEKTVNTTKEFELLVAVVQGTCFFRMDNLTSVLQSLSVHKFSTLIDQQQAMFNLSAFLGLKHSNAKDSIMMFLHFSESDGSIEFKKSARKEINGSSISQMYSLSQMIPPNTKYLTVWFTCEVFSSSSDQFCIFDQVTLSIFKKRA